MMKNALRNIYALRMQVVLLARVFGSAYWAGLQCSIVVFLALLDVLFVVTHRKQWEVPVPVSRYK